MSSAQTIEILGVKVNTVTMESTLEAIDGFIRDRRPHMLVTADASGIVMAQSDPRLKEIINTADLVTPDSTGVLWAARRSGTPLPAKVSGVDIVQRVCERGSKAGHRVYLLGSAPGVTDTAAERLKDRYPGLQVAGTHHGYFKRDETPTIVQTIREARADVLFVAMGIPVQEKWIADNMATLQVPVSMGVGGTFDVISGRVNRAPVWMQRHGLEWIHRLASNPRKIGKCMTLPIFVLMVLGLYRKRQ